MSSRNALILPTIISIVALTALVVELMGRRQKTQEPSSSFGPPLVFTDMGAEAERTPFDSEGSSRSVSKATTQLGSFLTTTTRPNSTQKTHCGSFDSAEAEKAKAYKKVLDDRKAKEKSEKDYARKGHLPNGLWIVPSKGKSLTLKETRQRLGRTISDEYFIFNVGFTNEGDRPLYIPSFCIVDSGNILAVDRVKSDYDDAANRFGAGIRKLNPGETININFALKSYLLHGKPDRVSVDINSKVFLVDFSKGNPR